MTAPTVGRIVHYVSHGTPPREDGAQVFPSACRAAVVTQVCDDPEAGVTIPIRIEGPSAGPTIFDAFAEMMGATAKAEVPS